MKRSDFGKLLNLKEDFILLGKHNRPGTANTLEFITVHNTSNTSKGADAASHAKFVKTKGFNMVNGEKILVSWHYTVDDKQIIKHLPINEMGFHARNNGNLRSIGIEICMNQGIDQNAAFLRAARLIAALRFDLKKPNDAVVPHQFWTGKDCPVLLMDSGKPGKKWKDFKELIKTEFATID